MAEIFEYVLHVQSGIDAAAWWLVAAAAVLALVLFAACLRRAWPFAPALAQFRRLQPVGKVAAICVFCALVWRGGAKNDGDRGGDGSRGDAEARRAGGAPGGSSFSSTAVALAKEVVATADADAINCVPPDSNAADGDVRPPADAINCVPPDSVKNNLRPSATPREIYSSTNFPLSVTSIAVCHTNRVVNVGLA